MQHFQIFWMHLFEKSCFMVRVKESAFLSTEYFFFKNIPFFVLSFFYTRFFLSEHNRFMSISIYNYLVKRYLINVSSSCNGEFNKVFGGPSTVTISLIDVGDGMFTDEGMFTGED